MATAIKTNSELLESCKNNWLENMRLQLNNCLANNYRHSIGIDADAPYNYQTLMDEAIAAGIAVEKSTDGNTIIFTVK